MTKEVIFLSLCVWFLAWLMLVSEFFLIGRLLELLSPLLVDAGFAQANKYQKIVFRVLEDSALIEAESPSFGSTLQR